MRREQEWLRKLDLCLFAAEKSRRERERVGERHTNVALDCASSPYYCRGRRKKKGRNDLSCLAIIPTG